MLRSLVVVNSKQQAKSVVVCYYNVDEYLHITIYILWVNLSFQKHSYCFQTTNAIIKSSLSEEVSDNYQIIGVFENPQCALISRIDYNEGMNRG